VVGGRGVGVRGVGLRVGCRVEVLVYVHDDGDVGVRSCSSLLVLVVSMMVLVLRCGVCVGVSLLVTGTVVFDCWYWLLVVVYPPGHTPEHTNFGLHNPYPLRE
jgi:hypothetical protein